MSKADEVKKTAQITLLVVFSMLLFFAKGSLHAQKKKKNKKKETTETLTKYERANAEYLLIDAEKYFLLEDYQRALAFLRQSLEIDPRNHAAHFKSAEIHYLTENLDEASSCIEKALALHKKNKYYYILAAKIYRGKNNLPLAVLRYEEMIQNTTGYGAYLYDLADMYEALNQYEKAINVIDMVQEPFSQNEETLSRKAGLLVNAKRYEEALALSKTLAEKYPTNTEYLVNYVALLSTYKSKEKAIEFLESYKTGKAKWMLTQLYMETGQKAKANTLLIATFEDQTVDFNNKILLMNDLLQDTIDQDNIDLLLELQQILETSHPDDKNVIKSATQVYGKLAEVDTSDLKIEYQNKAINSLLKVKAMDPSDFDTWNQALNALYNISSWDRLLENSEEALELFPNQALFYFFNGAAHFQMQQYDIAASVLLQGQKLAFNHKTLQARIMSKLGEVYGAKNEHQKAEEYFENALKLDAQSLEILNNYSLHLALHQRHLNKALEISGQLIKLAENRLDYIDTHAYVLFQAEQYTAAKKVMEEGLAFENAEPSGRVLEHYGDILANLGLIEEAVEQWLKAKELGNTSKKIDQKITNRAYYE